jgi:hypothetical protein
VKGLGHGSDCSLELKICSEQIEGRNILSKYNAAFWLVSILEVFFLALSKSTGIEIVQ